MNFNFVIVTFGNWQLTWQLCGTIVVKFNFYIVTIGPWFVTWHLCGAIVHNFVFDAIALGFGGAAKLLESSLVKLQAFCKCCWSCSTCLPLCSESKLSCAVRFWCWWAFCSGCKVEVWFLLVFTRSRQFAAFWGTFTAGEEVSFYLSPFICCSQTCWKSTSARRGLSLLCKTLLVQRRRWLPWSSKGRSSSHCYLLVDPSQRIGFRRSKQSSWSWATHTGRYICWVHSLNLLQFLVDPRQLP